MSLKLFGKNIFQVYVHHIMKIEYENCSGRSKQSTYTLKKIDTDSILEELESIGTTVAVSNLKHLLSVNGSRCEGFVFGGIDTPPYSNYLGNVSGSR